MTCSKFHVEDSQISSATLQHLVAGTIWCMEFVHPCIISTQLCIQKPLVAQLFLQPSRPALEPTEPPTQWMPKIKQPERKADRSSSFTAKIKNERSSISISLYIFMECIKTNLPLLYMMQKFPPFMKPNHAARKVLPLKPLPSLMF